MFPAPHEDELGQSEVATPREIASFLGGLAQRQVPLAGRGNGDKQAFLVIVLDVDEPARQFFLAGLPGAEPSGDLLTNTGATFSVRDGAAQVQFVVGSARQAQFAGHAGYRLDLPASLLRVQRRGIYRVAVPRENPPRCRLHLANSEELASAALDISVGGVGLMYQADEPAVVLGQILHGCRLMIPELGEFIISLRVRNQVRLVLPGGRHMWRIGCEFIDASSSVGRELQRYIFKIGRAGQAKDGP